MPQKEKNYYTYVIGLILLGLSYLILALGLYCFWLPGDNVLSGISRAETAYFSFFIAFTLALISNSIDPHVRFMIHGMIARLGKGLFRLDVENPTGKKERNQELNESSEPNGPPPAAIRQEDEERIAESVSESLRHQLVRETVEALKDSLLIAEYGRVFASTRQRLSNAIVTLGKRVNQNLMLGTFFALIGMFLLGIFLWSNPDSSDVSKTFAHFAPRFAVVFVIELFAYFFLNLYKSGLADIKYFQNELTNLESRLAALSSAIEFGNKKLVADVIKHISQTERNFVLSKGQTAVSHSSTGDDTTENLKILAGLLDKFASKGD